jgi:PAS domain S-box-containing protein
MFRNTWLIGLVLFGVNAAVSSAAINTTPNAFHQGAMGTVAGHAGLAIIAAASLLGIACLTIETRTRATLVRQLDHERDLSRRLWDASEDGMVVVDAETRVVEWNPAMERLTGISRSRAIGRTLTACPGLNHPSHHECLRLALQGVETASDPTDFVRADDANRTALRAYYSPLHTPRAEVAAAFVVITTRASRMTHLVGQDEIFSESAA